MSTVVVYRPSDNQILHVFENVQNVQVNDEHSLRWADGQANVAPNMIAVLADTDPVPNVGETYAGDPVVVEDYPSPERLKEILLKLRDRLVNLEDKAVIARDRIVDLENQVAQQQTYIQNIHNRVNTLETFHQ